MSSLEELERALHKAHEAGDEDAARQLAQEIQHRMRAQKTKQRGAVERFSAGTGVGVSRTLGMPVDLVNSLLSLADLGHPEPLGGSRNIQRMLSRVGMAVPPEENEDLGRAGRVGELFGTAATSGPLIVERGLHSAATQTLMRQPGVAGRIAQDVAQSAVQAPARFIANETLSAATAGLLGFEASARFPDSPGAQVIAEIIGGFGPQAATAGVKQVGRGVGFLSEKIPFIGPKIIGGARNFIRGMTKVGARGRAVQRVARAVEDPTITAARMRRTDILESAPLTRLQKTELEDLLALEKSIMESTPELTQAHKRQLAEVNKAIRASLLASEREVPSLAIKDYLKNLLDVRIQVAAAKAEAKLAKLGTRATREDLNVLVRNELESALKSARATERELYDNIDQTIRIPTKAAQEQYLEFKLDLPKALQEDIPKVARKYLDPVKPKATGGKAKVKKSLFLGNETSVKELRGVQSKLREEARIARSNDQFNKARISDDIADAINDDIANAVGGPEIREQVDVAVNYSRDLNDRFTRGAVGRVLGRERQGGVSVPETLTLETTVGRRGTRGAQETEKLLEAVRRSGDEPELRQYISEFLIDDFRREAVSGGRVDVKAADRWLKSNQDTLNKFPELKRTIEASKTSSDALSEVERMFDPNVSRASVFLKSPLGTEIEHVIKTANPRQAMEELVALAAEDETGKALKGLKSSFMDLLLRRSQMASTLDVNDVEFISGSRMTRTLDDPQIMESMKGLFNAKEAARIAKIHKTAIILDQARKAAPAGEGIIGDKPGRITSLLGRIIGAQLGRTVAGKLGGGTVQTPGFFASEVKHLQIAGIRDPARRLLVDAVMSEDDDLMKALLLPFEQNEERVRARLHAWTVHVLQEQYQLDEEE